LQRMAIYSGLSLNGLVSRQRGLLLLGPFTTLSARFFGEGTEAAGAAGKAWSENCFRQKSITRK